MRIVTSHDPKPIPLRNCDWIAVDDETYGGEPSDPYWTRVDEAYERARDARMEAE